MARYTPDMGTEACEAVETAVRRMPAIYNEQRSRFGLSHLVVDPVHIVSATNKAQHMVDFEYFGHDEPDGTPPGRFSDEAGCTARFIGENCGSRSTDDLISRTGNRSTQEYSNDGFIHIARPWMESPGHRRAMLGDWDTFGFGFAMRRDSPSMAYLVCHYGGERNWFSKVPLVDVHKVVSKDRHFMVRFFSDFSLLEWHADGDVSEGWQGRWWKDPKGIRTRIGHYETEYEYFPKVDRSVSGWEKVNGRFVSNVTLFPRYSDETTKQVMKILTYDY